jgi:hypothetical protein
MLVVIIIIIIIMLVENPMLLPPMLDFLYCPTTFPPAVVYWLCIGQVCIQASAIDSSPGQKMTG